MAGSNSIVKLPPSFNRENEFQPFKTRGVQYFQVDEQLATSATLTARNLFQMLNFTAATPNTITGPSLALIQQELNQRYLSNPGSTWEVVFHNTDTNAKTINFPGVTPNQLVIPPQTYFKFGFTVTGTTPFALNLFQGISAASQVTDPFSTLGSGYVVRTGAMYAVRQILSANPSLVITNPAAQAGDTSLSFSAALTSFAAFNESAGTGYVVRTGVGSYVLRNITAGTGISITNPDGQAGNTVISFNAATAAIPASAITTTYPAGYTVAPALTGPSVLQTDLNALFAWTGLLRQNVSPGSFPYRTAASGVYDGYVSAINVGGAGITITQTGTNPLNFTYTNNPATATTGTPVLGQTTQQAAFGAINTAFNPGTPGFLVNTAANTIVSRSLTAGTNIAITNPAGTAGNPVISFTPSGATTTAPTVFQQDNGGGPLQTLLTNGNDVLAWNDLTNAWVTSSALPTTRVLNFNNLRIRQALSIGPFQINASTTNDFNNLGTIFTAGAGSFNKTTGSPNGIDATLDINNAMHSFSMLAIPNTDNTTIWNTLLKLLNAHTLSDSTTHRLRFISCIANRNVALTPFYPITGSSTTNVRGEVFYVDGAGNVGMRGTLTNNGSGVFTGTVSASSFITTSTLSSKQPDSIQNLNTYLGATPAITMVNAMQPIGFLYNTDETYEEGDSLRYGFLADTLDTLGGKYRDLVAYDSEGAKWGMKQEAILPLLFQAFKELSARVDKINTVTAVTYDV